MNEITRILEAIGAPFGLSANYVMVSIAVILFVLVSILVFWLVSGSTQDKELVAAEKAKRKVQTLVKEGRNREAADLLAGSGLARAAAQLYAKAGQWNECVEQARIARDRDLLVVALEKAGDHRAAAAELDALRQLEKAYKVLARGGLFKEAAAMALKAGKPVESAKLYAKVSMWEEAGRAAAKAQDFALAAKMLLAGYESAKGDEKRKERAKYAVLASDAMVKLGKREAALKLLITAERNREAKELGTKYKLETLGTRLAVKAGNHDLAAWFTSQGGDERQAARVKADGLREEDPYAAAQCYIQAGDPLKAAQLFQKSGYPEEAADQYMRAERYADAVRIYEKEKKYELSARALARAGQYGDAAKRFERVGELSEAIQCFEKAGNHLQAARLAQKMKAYDRAIGILNAVSADSEDYKAARRMRGSILAVAQRHVAAIESLREGLEGESVRAETVKEYYRLARLLQHQGQAQPAMQVYKRVYAFDPAYEDVGKRLKAAGVQPGGGPPTAAPAGAAAPLPASNGRYVMLGEVGRGGMGIVYKAQDTQLDRIVAFKVLPEEWRQNPAAIKNFMREARAAASLTHPNVVIVHDLGENSEHAYLVMEFVEGGTLKQLLASKGRLRPPAAIGISSQILAGLQYAHEKKLVHRDIKSSNIMVASDGTVKIMDFGLAKVVREVANNQTVMGGTPFYMSPEQVQGGAVGPWSDLYSFGCTLFEMLTGKVPFEQGDIAYHHVHTPAPTLASAQPDVPQAFEPVVARLLAKKPEERFQQAAEVVAELQQIKENLKT